MSLFVQVLHLPLQITQMFFQLIEGPKKCLTTLMYDIDPMVNIIQKSLQMFQLIQAFLVLTNQPLGTCALWIVDT